MNRTVRALRAGVSVVVVLLAGCGDGSPAAPAVVDCGNAYPRLGYAGTQLLLPGGGLLAEASLGTPHSLQPVLTATPSACAAAPTYALESGAPPPGLHFDAATGGFAGTPTVAGGSWAATVTAVAPTWPGPVGARLIWRVDDPQARAWQGWSSRPAPGGAGAFAAIGGSWILLQPGPAGLSIQRSDDQGASWSLEAPGAAPPTRSGFAFAGDGNVLVVLGGHDGSGWRDDAWVLEAGQWRQSSADLPFDSAHAAALVAGKLYVFAGAELWRSADFGQTWTRVASEVFGTPALPPLQARCAAQFDGRLVVVASQWVYGTGASPNTFVRSSTDGGASWSDHPADPDSPLHRLNGGTGQCFVAGGRFFQVGSSCCWNTVASIASSADLVHWDEQPRDPRFTALVPVAGAVGANGRQALVYDATLFTTTP